MWQLWTLVFVVCLILELFSGDFFIMSFAIGGLFAALSTMIGGIYVQLTVFVVFTLISIFLVRPVAIKWLHRGEDKRVSNADALMGRIGTVSDTIMVGGYGRVAIDGDDWKAEASSTTNDDIPKGSRVKVVGRESIILTVEKLVN